jgi:hypothetical protein
MGSFDRVMGGGAEERERLRRLAEGYEVFGEATREFERHRPDPARGGEWVAFQLEHKPTPVRFLK